MSTIPFAAAGLQARISVWLRPRLPQELVALLRELRRLKGTDRRRFASLRLRRALRTRFDPSTLRPHPSVVFVCHGNKLRSPMAEALLRKTVAEHGPGDVHVRSAGTHAVLGMPVPHAATHAASRHGVSLAAHEAQALTEALVRDADVVFVMDRSNEADLLTRFADAERRVVMLGALVPDRLTGAIIPDPDNGTAADLERCYSRLDACVSVLARQLLPARRPAP